MSDYTSRLIEGHPAETLHRVRGLLAVYAAVDVDSRIQGLQEGHIVLLDEVNAVLEYVIDQVTPVSLEHFQGGES